MERKDFLKGLGVIGIGSLLPLNKTKAAAGQINTALLPANTCILIPQETAGPYPWSMGTSPFFRQDITEGNPGTPLNLTLTVVDVNNSCAPIQNARVDIWHCNRDGYYSEYGNQPGYLGTQTHVGETFFRGYQISDVNGEVNFVTIYPGWYNGRATHIHMQIFLNSVLQATSQMAFPDSLNTTINGSSGYSAHGQNSLANANDNVFSDTANTQYEIVNIAASGSGGYDASLTIGIALPVTGVINLEPETGGQFKLGVNYPNPFKTVTNIPFKLTNPSHVKMDIYDMQGKKVIELINQKMMAGEQTVVFNRQTARTVLPEGNYVYQLEVENSNGNFRQCKVFTIE